MNIFRNRVVSEADESTAVDDRTNGTQNYDEEEASYEENGDDTYEQTDALLLPGDGEKNQMIAMFCEMRKETFFCDVAFLCHGVLFRAHRVVVSSWSRWLRALLCESPDEEVLSLDVFDATAFSSVLDYMYGIPLNLKVENADSIIKVVRRLEMQKLEQQCWRYLMTIIDPHTNCELLHELADRYDCPPLKLAAWRILQETVPGYSMSPAAKLLRRGNKMIPIFETGLTGPGDAYFNSNSDLYTTRSTARPASVVGSTNDRRSNRHSVDSDEDDDEDEKDRFPSVFDDVTEDEDDEDSQGSDAESKSQFSRPVKTYTHPANLPATATAAEVIKAWAARLKDVLDSCEPQDADDFQDPNHFHISKHSRNVKLLKTVIRPNEHTTTASPSSSDRETHKDRNRGGERGGGRWGTHVQSVTENNTLANSSPNSTSRKPHNQSQSNASRTNTTAPSQSRRAYGDISSFDETNKPNKSFLNRSKQLSNGRSIDWRVELQRFYTSINMPEKIPSIPTVMETWAGREDDMIVTMIQKYKRSIPSHMLLHLDQLQMILSQEGDGGGTDAMVSTAPATHQTAHRQQSQQSMWSSPGGSSKNNNGGGGGGGTSGKRR